MMTNAKMSIFNRYVDPFTKQVTFKKHVIDNVFWDDEKQVSLDDGFEKTNRAEIYIPHDKNDLTNYVIPKRYNGSNWTINDGDFIVKGEVVETEVNGIKDLSQYYVFEIMSWSNKDYGSPDMWHFEIIGDSRNR